LVWALTTPLAVLASGVSELDGFSFDPVEVVLVVLVDGVGVDAGVFAGAAAVSPEVVLAGSEALAELDELVPDDPVLPSSAAATP
jgi:hypothetical protein